MALEEENLQLKQLLETKNTELELIVSQLLQCVKNLEQQLAKNSRNSSKPPASNGFNSPPKNHSLRQKSSKNSGGQLDYQGYELALTKQSDHVVTYANVNELMQNLTPEKINQGSAGWPFLLFYFRTVARKHFAT